MGFPVFLFFSSFFCFPLPVDPSDVGVTGGCGFLEDEEDEEDGEELRMTASGRLGGSGPKADGG